ncbi:MAG: HD-GYP domain-containing protein [Rhodocyclaceae bacterium]|nr:HD-GYP domain-containing protein [Rhodocyclaceae bacterium]
MTDVAPTTAEPAAEPHLRQVSVDQLRPGMFVHDLQKGWLTHFIWRKQFAIKETADINRLKSEGIREVVIDTRRGDDVRQESPELSQEREKQRFAVLDRKIQEATQKRVEQVRASVSLEEERWRVQYLRRDATATVRDLMTDIRLGKQADIRRAEEVVDKMMASVGRNPDALIPLLRLKSEHAYSYEHSISVAAMVIALGGTLGLENDVIHQASQGALLQDLGKARIPERILDKPGRLNDFEFERIRSHVRESINILENVPGMSDLTMNVVVQHHERVNGSGYPFRLAGDAISLHAQAAAIVDAYDALTSERPFQRRLEPSQALRELYAAAGTHFRPDLIQAFIRTLGIYPVGSLVRLENQTLAVVTEQNRDNLLKPVVRVIFSIRDGRYLRPSVLDLGRRLEAPAIISIESYERWGIDPQRWQPA